MRPYRMYGFGKPSDRHVFIDEELQVLQHHRHQLPQTHQIVTDHLELEPHNPIYSRITVPDMEELREKGRNREDDESLSPPGRHQQDPKQSPMDSFVDTEQFEKLKSGAGKRLSVHSVLKPSVLEGSARSLSPLPISRIPRNTTFGLTKACGSRRIANRHRACGLALT